MTMINLAPRKETLTKNNATFDQWLKRIDNNLIHHCGFSYLDLPDMDYADMYENGVNSKNATKQILRNIKEI